MKFWKDHSHLRTILIALFFILGVVLTIVGWKMTKQLRGLIIMIVGIICLLTALFVYNAAYKD